MTEVAHKSAEKGTEQSTSKEVALTISDLTFAYPKQDKLFQSFDLQVHNGRKVGLIGPNGSGKTTLFLLTCGILAAKSGNISILDQSMDVGKFNSNIGLVFQNPNDQLFTTCVRDDVAFGPKNMGLDQHEIDERVHQSLAATGTEDLIDRVPQNLSGGEKSMVAIATVLAMRPRLILYDEPSASLDLYSRRQLIQFLQKSQETILVSTHDLELVLEVCDRVLLLDDGCVVADGKPAKIMSDVELMQAHRLEKPHSLSPHVHFG
ncbi:ABC transporter ATP-binding protein [Romeria aff. gracilis LEGE 07310]|uniref:ABC transporter ATP-binding protein n=1 Tax=Vasconcelosia minhoensis LEGE 07310 TaxID=915328 RepID=A0A8J7AB79_9CYAN|nr:ABC transporter ATP-binding protein [Romeria gracilis]MBE9079705.1 ABC transporter ATP-binding protein [Romeria aff. gracilis LEGE 07310]